MDDWRKWGVRRRARPARSEPTTGSPPDRRSGRGRLPAENRPPESPALLQSRRDAANCQIDGWLKTAPRGVRAIVVGDRDPYAARLQPLRRRENLWPR